MPIEFSEETWAQFTPAQRESLIFMEQMTGAHITDAEPAPDSPLGRITALIAARDAGRITAEECTAAIMRIQREPSEDDHL